MIDEQLVLALGGGAARGLAHIGVLRGLEEDGVDIAGVAGTSMGSIVGAMIAQGLGADEIQGIFEEIDWPTLGRIMLRSVVGTAFHDLLRETLGRGTIESLRIPYAAVCCDLETGERVVLRSGPIADAARASSSIPGIISPLQQGGRTLVDGVVVDPVPITTAEELGCGPVLAVNVLRPAGPEDGPLPLREPRRGRGVPSAVFDRLDHWLRSHRDGEEQGDPGRHSRWEVVMRSFHIMAYRLASSGCPPAAMIEPEVGRFAWFDFPSAPDIIERGYQAYRGWRNERPADGQ